MTITSILAAFNYYVLESIGLGFGSQNFPDQLQPSYTFTAGTGSKQGDQHWEATAVTLLASASVTYALSALTVSQGRTVAFGHVKGMLVTTSTRSAGDYLTT